MLSKNEIKRLEKKYGFIPLKRLGQNFLIDENVKNNLFERFRIDKNDVVLEIGSGLGQLTFDIAQRVRRVIAIEYDKKLFAILSDLAGNFTNVILVNEDFLKLDLKGFIPKKGKLKVFSNLPYSISSPVLLKLFAHNFLIDSALVTLQKEVADRLTAKAGSKDYGSLTLFAEYHAEIRRLFPISKNSFYPRPKVDSAVITINMRQKPPVSVNNKKELFDLIRDGFSMRRKTLINAVSAQHYKKFDRKQLERVLISSGISPDARAEALSLADFARIVNSI